jgi:hypothetical protein
VVNTVSCSTYLAEFVHAHQARFPEIEARNEESGRGLFLISPPNIRFLTIDEYDALPGTEFMAAGIMSASIALVLEEGLSAIRKRTSRSATTGQGRDTDLARAIL